MDSIAILLTLKVLSYFLLIGLGILIPQKWLLGLETNCLKIFAARFIVFLFLIGFVYLMLLDTIPMLHSGKGLLLYTLNGYGLAVLPALLIESMDKFHPEHFVGAAFYFGIFYVLCYIAFPTLH